MQFKKLKLKIKNELKQMANDIRVGKSLRKPHLYHKASSKDKKLADSCEYNRLVFRHKHIVYCMMFKKTPYEKIEQPREFNRPCGFRLKRYRDEWSSLLDEEVVRTNP